MGNCIPSRKFSFDVNKSAEHSPLLKGFNDIARLLEASKHEKPCNLLEENVPCLVLRPKAKEGINYGEQTRFKLLQHFQELRMK